MIPMGKEQHLEYKALFLFALRRVTVGVIILLLALIVGLLRQFIVIGISSVVENLNFLSTANINVTSIVMFLDIILFLFGVFTTAIGLLVAWLEHKNYTYRFDEFNFLIKTGIINKYETLIPYRQIQDVHIKRSLIYQVLGLSTVDIKMLSTEQESGHVMDEVVIDKVDKFIAEEIRSVLSRKIGIQITEDKFKDNKVPFK